MTEAMSRLNDALRGSYSIERELGEGGMATVYLAEDLKHQRKVALKVLKPELAAVVGAERFLAEIRVTANLQHPNILPLFDSGEADRFLYYVMPYVEGESLQDRLDREKQLPVDEAVRITTEVAGALDHAHRQGVIHRDIKPANLLLRDGRPLIADFGIALALGAAGSRLTETGLSLGTPYYMSPEQAAGDQQVGPPSDIYALGAVLYEMLAGQPPFVGGNAQAVLGKILTEEPQSLRRARRATPENVEAAVLTALERVPADRFATGAELVAALTDGHYRRSSEAGSGAGAGPAIWKWTSIAATIAAISLASVLVRTQMGARVVPSRWSVALPAGEAIVDPGGLQSLGISRDGDVLVYTGADGAGGWQLLVRHRNDLSATPLPRTQGAFSPAVSPSGTQVAFLTGDPGPVNIVDLDGRTVPRNVTTGNDAGLYWGKDETLYFQSTVLSGLSRIVIVGGEEEVLSVPDTSRGETRHRWPHALPDGRGVLFTILRGEGEFEVAVLDLDSDSVTVLLENATSPSYSTTGHLIWATPDGDLLGAKFDLDQLEITGPHTPLLEGVAVGLTGAAQYSFSETGTLVYRTPGLALELDAVVFDRSGAQTPFDPTWRPQVTLAQSPAWSPDGRTVAVSLGYSGGTTIRIQEAGGRGWPITFDPASRHDHPSWTLRGDSVVYTARPVEGAEVWIRDAEGAGNPELLIRSEAATDIDAVLSKDGAWLVYAERTNDQGDIYARSRSGQATTLRIAVDGGFDERAPSLSWDGTMLAYVSDEPGEPTVYVRRFPDEGPRYLAATGTEPVWSNSGPELFYRSASNELFRVDVNTTGEISSSGHERLFSLAEFPQSFVEHPIYDVSPDGETFIVVRTRRPGVSPGEGASRLIWIDGWFSELNRRIPN